jgi:hypothetical protein
MAFGNEISRAAEEFETSINSMACPEDFSMCYVEKVLSMQYPNETKRRACLSALWLEPRALLGLAIFTTETLKRTKDVGNRHGTNEAEPAEIFNDRAKIEHNHVNANREIIERQNIHETIKPEKKEQPASMVRESKCPGCGKAWRLNAFLYSISPFKCPVCGTKYTVTKQ